MKFKPCVNIFLKSQNTTQYYTSRKCLNRDAFIHVSRGREREREKLKEMSINLPPAKAHEACVIALFKSMSM
jgi:hypothetical protein